MSQHADILTFEQHGARFWERGGPYQTLHDINPARVQLIAETIPLRGAHLLDLGCGGGILSEALARRGAKVTGIDLSAAVLASARAHAQAQGLSIDYRQQDSAQCLHDGLRFDHITCMEMLEHVANPAAVIADIAQLLRPGGYVFFSTINRNWRAFLGAICAAEQLLRIVPKGTHQYGWLLTPAELVATVEHAGLNAVALRGLHYNPWTHRAQLSADVAVNYFLIAQKP